MTENYEKRDWIVRTTDIFNDFEIGVIYNAPSIRDKLREKYKDSISTPTLDKLLSAIIDAQEKGLNFIIDGRTRKLIQRETATNDKLYEIIEED